MTARPDLAATLPPPLRAHLEATSLQPLWAALRHRLERNGMVALGTVDIDVDDDGADRLAGLLARPMPTGKSRLKLADLDRALRESAAARGLPSIVAELTGLPLHDRVAERSAARAESDQLWRLVDNQLARVGLAGRDWVADWTVWLRRSGILTRLAADVAAATVTTALRVLTEVMTADSEVTTTCLRGELAMRCTGTAHGLDDGTTVAALVLRALTLGYEVAAPMTAADRRSLWQRAGVTTDEVSGTVLTWGLRPPGRDRWSAMMRERAALGLVSHLTAGELQAAPALAAAGEIVYGCENPQVLQSLAVAHVAAPIICTSGNPAVAGSMLLSRVSVRYHGDFDWPGLSIARRLFAVGARPWLYGASDYIAAVERITTDVRLPLNGRAVETPWDPDLGPAMKRIGTVVHEEAVLDVLLADLS